MNKKALIGWVIIGILIFLILAGIIYFKFNSTGLAIGSGNSSISIDYNGTINFNDSNQTSNSTNSTSTLNSETDYQLSFNVTE